MYQSEDWVRVVGEGSVLREFVSGMLMLETRGTIYTYHDELAIQVLNGGFCGGGHGVYDAIELSKFK